MALGETLTIESAGLTATISAKGAELQSLAPTGGAELIWSADPEYWGWHAPNLFPIVGAVAGGLLVHEGKSYPIKNHGFLRHTICAATQDGPDACSFRLSDDAETRAQYPFAFALTIAYRAEADRLACVWSLRNPAETTLYASLGLHPAFRWPLAGAARAAHFVLFDEPEPAPIRRLDGRGLLAPEPIATPVRGRVLRLTDTLFDHDALIFDRPVSRKLTYGAPGGPAVALEFPDFPELGIWSKPGAAPFVCLEPWQGLASPSGYSGEFAQKPGVIALAPGETRQWRYAIRPLAAMPEAPET